eukprot:scaffold673472_cov48-Prasinocladus_malaysianus.AAC.1
MVCFERRRERRLHNIDAAPSHAADIPITRFALNLNAHMGSSPLFSPNKYNILLQSNTDWFHGQSICLNQAASFLLITSAVNNSFCSGQVIPEWGR